MTGLWIRVAANIGNRKVVWRLVTSCGLSVEAAVGTLVMFWGAVAENTKGGRIDDVPDDAIEAWANWRGERGAFARFVREQHTTDGVVNEWDDYAGALEDRREKDRERKRRARNARESAGSPADSPRDTARTVRNGTEQRTTPSTSAARQRLTDRLSSVPGGEAALTAFLDGRPAARDEGSLVAAVNGWLDGLGMPGGKAPAPSVVVTALADYVAGESRDYNPKHLRSFVVREMNNPPKAGEAGSPGRARRDVGQEAFNTAMRVIG